MIFKESFLVVLALLSLSLSAKGQDNTLIQKLIDEGRQIKEIQPWNVKDGPLLCVYSSGSDQLIDTSTALSFYRRDTTGYVEIFRYRTYASPVGIIQSSEYNGNLMVEWIGASSYGITAFSYLDGKVRVAMKASSKIRPEFAFSDFNDPEYAILVTQKDWITDKTGGHELVPTTTKMYKWVTDHYDTLSVPWKERFNSSIKKK